MPFTVSATATDRKLLTLDEAKAALGITTTNYDLVLPDLVTRISDAITDECAVPGDGLAVPTLLQETIIETFRPGLSFSVMRLARRPVTSVAAVVEAGTTLGGTDYEIETGAGLLRRLSGDTEVCWACGKIVVTYQAGFAAVPELLKLAAIAVLREQWAMKDRDPLLRSENIPDIGEKVYWTGGLDPGNGAAMSSQARAMLSRFRYFGV